eukprot:COSAG06_NODE_18949_length_859_cov_2.161629_1_plen_139_part_00
MGVAESAAGDWPQVLCVICHLTRPHGWLCCCAAVLLDWWDGCGCVRLVRTARKSLAMHAAMPFVCLLLPPPLCVWALLRAPPPIGLKCCVFVWCDQGGAIYVEYFGQRSNAQLDIRGSVLSNNQAVRGGGGALARHER